MFFFSSSDGQMTWNAFKTWLMTDEATHSLEALLGRMHSYELERWLRDEDSLKRRERIARKCVSIAKNDEYFRGQYIFRGDAGDAGCPSDCKCLGIEEHPFKVALTRTEFGRLVGNLPEIDLHLREDVGLGQGLVEDRRIVRELFRSFVAKIQQLRAQDCSCYSSVMLRLESLPSAYHKVKKYERWFVISYSHGDDQRSKHLPWAYKTVKKAKEALKRLAEHIVPRDWDRCKIVIDDGAAKIAKLESPHQGGSAQRQMEIRLQVEREPVSVPKDRLIPIDNPPVEDWDVARAKDWEMRKLTMERWLEKLDPRNCEGSGAERSSMSEWYAQKCDWWKFDFPRLESREWVLVLRHRPDLIDKCPVVDVFSDSEWCLLLRRQPQFADRFDRWEVLAPNLWCFLLRRQPQFAERFSGWDEIDADCWTRLLKDQPQFSERCPWNKLSGCDWKELLIARPEFRIKLPTLASMCNWNAFSEEEIVSIVAYQKSLIDFVPRGRIVSRRAWIDLSKQNDACRRRFLQELNIDALDGRAITDILLELPELAERLPTDRITDEIDKKRLTVIQREVAENIFGGAVLADCWSNSYKWKGRDGIILGVRVQGDLFSLPDTIGPCDAIAVMTIRGRSKQIIESYENWKTQNAESCKKVVFEEVPPHRTQDDQLGYSPPHYYSIEDGDVTESLNRAFASLSQKGVRSVAINGIEPEGSSFKKLIEDWFHKNSSSISVVYLVDKKDAHAFGS